MIQPITNCRVCNSDQLEFLFSIGEQYVSNFLLKGEDPGEKVPIELVLCKECTLVQLRHTAPQEILYKRFYWYRSGVTQTMRDALRDITKKIEGIIDLQPGDVVLDIGSNDGTLLRSYTKSVYKVGVEPATNLAQDGSRELDCFIGDFWTYQEYMSRVKQYAKVITAIGMFYDLDDPNSFIRDVANSLSSQGIFVAQLMCLKNMVNINDVGNLAHEHLEFYSLKSLEYLFGKHKLKIFDIEINKVNGESYRIFAKLKDSPNPYHKKERYHAISRMQDVRDSEKGLDDVEFYKELFLTMERNKNKTVEFIKREYCKGKKIFVYGASTKGNVILQYYGLDSNWITGAADKSPEKWGRFTVGTNIPIMSEAKARAEKPDYFLILPYAFLDEFVEREKLWRDGGGKFIVPLPEMKIV